MPACTTARQKAGNTGASATRVAGGPGTEKGPAETAVAEVMLVSANFSVESDAQDAFARARAGERETIRGITGQARANWDLTVAQDYRTKIASVKLR